MTPAEQVDAALLGWPAALYEEVQHLVQVMRDSCDDADYPLPTPGELTLYALCDIARDPIKYPPRLCRQAARAWYAMLPSVPLTTHPRRCP